MPHHVNMYENQHYIGVIQTITNVGANTMNVEYLPDFNKRDSAQSDIIYWSFKYN